jgi:hypothetical protein
LLALWERLAAKEKALINLEGTTCYFKIMGVNLQ